MHTLETKIDFPCDLLGQHQEAGTALLAGPFRDLAADLADDVINSTWQALARESVQEALEAAVFAPGQVVKIMQDAMCKAACVSDEVPVTITFGFKYDRRVDYVYPVKLLVEIAGTVIDLNLLKEEDQRAIEREAERWIEDNIDAILEEVA